MRSFCCAKTTRPSRSCSSWRASRAPRGGVDAVGGGAAPRCAPSCHHVPQRLGRQLRSAEVRLAVSSNGWNVAAPARRSQPGSNRYPRGRHLHRQPSYRGEALDGPFRHLCRVLATSPPPRGEHAGFEGDRVDEEIRTSRAWMRLRPELVEIIYPLRQEHVGVIDDDYFPQVLTDVRTTVPAKDLPSVPEAAFGRNPDGATMDHPHTPQPVDGQGDKPGRAFAGSKTGRPLGRHGRRRPHPAMPSRDRRRQCSEPSLRPARPVTAYGTGR